VSVRAQARPIDAPPAAPRLELPAWAVILAAAFLLRVARIGEPPLSPDEAQRALEAWSLYREGRAEYAAGPLLTNLLSFLFALFTAGDGQARLPSVVAGTALVALPWLFRPALGAWGALGAAVVLTLCPPLLVLSRTASPAILVLLFTLLTAAAASRFARDADPRWLIAACTSLLLGLAADPSFVLALGGLILAVAIAEGELLVRPPWLASARAALPGAVGTAVLVAVLVDTRLLMNPGGFQAGLVDPLWRWTGDVVRGAGLLAPLLLLLIDGGTILLALVGLTTYRRHERAVRILGTWLVVAVPLAALVRQPDLRYLAQPLLPASLLAGLGLARLVEVVIRNGTQRSAVFGLCGLIPLVTAGFQVNAALRSGQDSWVSAGIVVLAGLLIVALIALNSLPPAGLGAAFATFLLAVTALWGVTSASRLLEARGGDRAHLLEAAVTTDELDLVREEALKWYRADPEGTIPVDPALEPLVGWALRDIPTVRYDPDATGRSGVRLLAEVPATVAPDTRTVRLIVGYGAERPAVQLSAPRIWRWVVGRQSLVDLRPYAILVIQPAGS
jgi:4-amino-4-deoxy-L-arabinose transferase-like glycosyltransferase